MYKFLKLCRLLQIFSLFFFIFHDSIATDMPKDNRKIRVGFFAFDGYHMMDSHGNKSGYGYDYLQNIAPYNGWIFEYIGHDLSWDESLKLLENGTIDLLTSATKTPERMGKFYYSKEPLGYSSMIMSVRANEPTYIAGDYQNWNGIKVGFLHNNSRNQNFANFAKEKGFTYQPFYYNKLQDMKIALEKTHEVDALVTSNLRAVSNEWIYEQLDTKPFYAIVKNDNKKLIEQFDFAMEEVKKSNPSIQSELKHKYYLYSLDSTIPLTIQERNFIKNSNDNGKVFKAVINPDRIPFSYLQDGAIVGIMCDIVKKALEKTNLNIEIIVPQSRKEYREFMKNNDIELILDAIYDLEIAENNGYFLTRPYLRTSMSRIYHKSNSAMPKVFGVVQNSDIAYNLSKRSQYQGKLKFYKNNNELIEAVKNGQLESALIYTKTAENAITNDHSETLVSDLLHGYTSSYAIGIRRNAELELISIINKAINSITAEDVEDTIQSYMLQDNNKISILDYIRLKPITSLSILFALFVLIIIFFLYFLIVQRKNIRNAHIFSKLPINYFVADIHGNILQNQNSLVQSTPKNVSEIDELSINIQKYIYDTITTGDTNSVSYEYNGRKRSASISKLPLNLFGVEAAVWISWDITQQSLAIETMENTNRLWFTVMNVLPLYFSVLDADDDYRYIMVNNRISEFLDMPMDKIVGKNDKELLSKHPSLINLNVINNDDIMEKVDGVEYTCDLLDSQGKNYHLNIIKKPFINSVGKRLLLVAGLDISMLHNLLQSEKINNEVLSYISLESDFDKILSHIADTLKQQMNCDRIIFAKANSNGFLRLSHDWHGDDSISMTQMHLTELYNVWDKHVSILKNNHTMKFDDFSGSPMTKDIAKAMHFTTKSIMAVPIFVNEEFFGAIFVAYSKELRHFTDIDERIMRMTSNLISISEMRRRKKDELAETQTILQSLLDNLPVGIVVKDADDDFSYLMCNPKFCHIVNLPKESILGRRDVDLPIFSNLVNEMKELDKKTVTLNKSFHSGIVLDSKSTGLIYLERFKIPLMLPNGKKLLLVAFMDTTKLNNLIEAEKISNTSLSNIVIENNFDKNVSTILKTMLKQMGSDHGTLVHFDSENNNFSFLAEESVNNYYLMNNMTHAEEKLFYELNYNTFINNKLSICLDVKNSKFNAIECFDILQSFIGAPIFIKDKLWGAVFVGFSAYRRIFSEVDERIMRSTANMIALAQIRDQHIQELERVGRENQLILNNIKIPIFMHDSTGKMIRVNTAACEMAKLSNQELLASPCKDIFCKEKNPSFENCSVQKALATRQPVKWQMSYNKRQYNVNTEPIFDANGNIINIVQSSIDVTELNALIDNEQILNSCMAKILEIDDVNIAINFILQTLCEHLHAERAHIWQIVPQNGTIEPTNEYNNSGINNTILDIQPQNMQTLEQFKQHITPTKILFIDNIDQENQKYNNTLCDNLNDTFQAKSIYFAGIFSKGEMISACIISYEKEYHIESERETKFIRAATRLIEITIERDRNRQIIIEALNQAKAADRAKSYFLASMSHEIRTPLNAVIGFSELLKDHNVDFETQKEYLSGIASAGNALLDLINDVLDLSKLEAGQMLFHPVETDFISLVKEVGQIFRQKRLEKNLSAEYEMEVMPIILIDKLRLRQILFNLMGNALKFTEKGKLSIKSRFEKVNSQTGTLIFQVTDTGIGIPEEDQKSLFQPFVQASAMRGTHAANSGTGLGLSIISRMLEKMNGKIELNSKIGLGSTFIVTLNDIEYINNYHKPDNNLTQLDLRESQYNHQVLIVDDIPMNLKVLQAMLHKLGCQVYTANNGIEALKVLNNKNEINIVLTDLWMPVMNGAILAQTIRNIPSYKHLTVAAISADLDGSQNFDMSFFDSVLTKPINIEKLKNFCESKNKTAK